MHSTGKGMEMIGIQYRHYQRYNLDDTKKEDKFMNIKDFVRTFDATGYFYGEEVVPNDGKIVRGMYVIKPEFDY